MRRGNGKNYVSYSYRKLYYRVFLSASERGKDDPKVVDLGNDQLLLNRNLRITNPYRQDFGSLLIQS